METLVAVVDQVGMESYPVSTTKIKRREHEGAVRVFLPEHQYAFWTAFLNNHRTDRYPSD